MIRNKKSKKGQIVVFMVLIFQMLFIFIAMVVNIGLVVHDKINLQNSVDLAAIYGAQRQAEILNAMAHVNYQIRQSYKLMAWRYFILGNLGANYRKSGGAGGVRYNINSAGPNANSVNHPYLMRDCPFGPRGATASQANTLQCPYAVCLAHLQWSTPGVDRNTGSDHRCQQIDPGPSQIARPTAVIPSSLGSIAIGGPIEKLILQRASASFNNSCETMQLLNWYVAASFLYSFRLDQWKRKILAMALFDQLLKENKDIEGEDIRDGVVKTLQNNLTFVNYVNFNPSSNILIESSVNGKNFNDYFEWQQIAPILFYVFQRTPDPPSNILCYSDFLPILHPPENCDPPGSPTSFVSCNHHLWISSRGSELIGGTPDQPLHLSSGFYKKNIPLPPISIQVRAEFLYSRQIFFPIKEIILRAEAYAKPFGSGFGPPQNADPLLPKGPFPAFPSGSSLSAGAYAPFLQFAPNHSLYPGDQQGLYNHAVQWFWTQQLAPRPPEGFGKKTDNYIISEAREEDPLVVDRQLVGDDSLQAIDAFLTTPIRILEEKAMAPDLFDLAYYTILPDYMTTLYQKMVSNNTFKAFVEGELGGASIPGDLGFLDTSRVGMRPFNELPRPDCYDRPSIFRFNFIQKQIECLPSSPFLHKVSKTEHLLTSWSPPKAGGYKRGNMYNLGSISTHPLGECQASNDKVDIQNPLSGPQNTLPQYCLAGGRSGFSVKLIHPRMAR